MTDKPKLLDLFSGAGGAAMGYYRAGFDVVGVDIVPQSRYPFRFIQADALEYLAEHGHEYNAIHASPPCQAYSNTQKLQGNKHPELIEPTRKLLRTLGKPYVIENVPGAPLINPTWLVGSMFGLMTMKPRLFECSFDLPFMLAPPPSGKQCKMGRKPKPGEYIQVVGHYADAEYAKQAMGIDWMNRNEMAQAIPPAYTEYIGKHLFSKVLNFGVLVCA